MRFFVRLIVTLFVVSVGLVSLLVFFRPNRPRSQVQEQGKVSRELAPNISPADVPEEPPSQ